MQIAVQEFITYVNGNIVEPFLTDPKGPLLGLSNDYLRDLEDDDVEFLGGEDETITTARRNCEEKIKRLEKAEQIAAMTWKKTKEMSI